MASRAATPALGARASRRCVEKAARYYNVMGQSSFAPGNAEGGLTTIEEKSLGAYAKSGASPIVGLIKPGDLPPTRRPLSAGRGAGRRAALRVPEHQRQRRDRRADRLRQPGDPVLDRPRLGGRLGHRPVIKVCANPGTYRRMADDMDVDAGRILEGRATLDEVGREILTLIERVARRRSRPSRRQLGHREFIMGYKQFEPTGPSCLPEAA